MNSVGSDEAKIEISIPSVSQKDVTEHSWTELNQNRRSGDIVDCRCYGWSQRVDPRCPLNNTTTAITTPVGCGNEVRRRFHIPQTINWAFLINYCKKWAKQPMNMAILVWLAFVTTGLIVLALLAAGLIIPNRAQRERWTEIDNQILNALYMIMCMYQHPKFFYHTVLLIRWAPADILESRNAYCKSPAQRPYERTHIAFVVFLLHITCFSQYFLCGIYWGFTSKTRPVLPDILGNVISIIAPIIAGLYAVLSPLGQNYEVKPEPEPEPEPELKVVAKPDRVKVPSPKWAGGLFDCCDDPSVTCMSMTCTCCVFGWNMERLGLGNMYVHVVTFAVFIIAPVWVFYMSALNIDDDVVRLVMEIYGGTLSFFGLLYGGYWRVQMRKRYGLPGSEFCCDYPAVTDFVQWLFCWSCSLAQEVRTGNWYDFGDAGFYMKETINESVFREYGSSRSISMVTAGESLDSFSVSIDGEMNVNGEDHLMTPPIVPHLVRLSTNQEAKR